MAKPNVTWLANWTVNEGANTGNATGGAGASSSNWLVIDRAADLFAWCSEQQNHGDLLTGPRYPVIIPAAGTNEGEKTFVKDASAGTYVQIPLAGTIDGGQSGGNKRYVFCVFFDGPTAGIPALEAWNSGSLAAFDHNILGGGTATHSAIKAIRTTEAVPGSTTWLGTGLAGPTAINLDTDVLGAAKNLYWNMKLLLDAARHNPVSTTSPVLSLRYLYN
jgi:hypothetical protein